MLSYEERYEEDIDQVQYLLEYSEKKECKRNERRKKREEIIATFRSSPKE